MQQSNVIFGALFLAFIVYITVKGELPVYISLLKGSSNAATTAPTSTSSTIPAPFSANSLDQQVENLLSQSPGIQINAPAPPNVVP